MTVGKAVAASATRASEAPDQVLAWTTFWQEQGPQSRCLDGALDLHQILSDHWISFAASLRPAARVLDLGCGSGVVARTLAYARRGLHVVGVDSAQIPPPGDPMFQIVSGAAMESLPFADGAFDAAVSQFGFEYGSTREAARELARVLIPGARFAFVVHHSESSIVRDSCAGNRAVKALTGRSVRASFLSGDAAVLTGILQSLVRRYPDDPVLRLATPGLLSAVARPSGDRLRIWGLVVDALAPERILADALEACCVAPDKLTGWLQSLSPLLRVHRAFVLSRGAEPLAWKIEGERAV